MNRPDNRFYNRLDTVPLDLLLVFLVLLISDISIVAPVVKQTPLRIPFGFLLVAFIPGYVFTFVLFPHARRSTNSPNEGDVSGPRGIDGIERVVLSIAFSLVINMSIALTLHQIQLGIHLWSTLVSLNLIIILMIIAAIFRRSNVPESRRFTVDLDKWIGGVRSDLSSYHGLDRILLVGLVGIVLIGGGGVAYTLWNPGPDDRYTELYILNENESGSLIASDYPTDFAKGEPTSIVIGIRNHEYETTTYTIVVELQRTVDQSQSSSVIEERSIHEFQTTLQHSEVWRLHHNVTPPLAGNNLRLIYFLYVGEPPANPSPANAYRHVYLWIDVQNQTIT